MLAHRFVRGSELACQQVKEDGRFAFLTSFLTALFVTLLYMPFGKSAHGSSHLSVELLIYDRLIIIQVCVDVDKIQILELPFRVGLLTTVRSVPFAIASDGLRLRESQFRAQDSSISLAYTTSNDFSAHLSTAWRPHPLPIAQAHHPAAIRCRYQDHPSGY